MSGVLAVFRRRTEEGIQALRHSLLRATREPERAGYLLAADLNTWTPLLGQERLKRLAKPMLMPLLSGRVLRSPASAAEKSVALLGLAGGCFGDVILLQPGKLPQGALGFGINHLAYLWLLWQRGARPSTTRIMVRAVPLAMAVGLVARKRPRLVPVAAGYGSLLAAVSALGDDPALLRESIPTLGLGHGGNLFLLSDALLIGRELLLGREGWPAKLADAGVMGTYTIAQMLLVDGLFPDGK
ncbi:lysoplasmalogenase [Corynebacterium occultum]|uniref:lysoplasmalogenase n=1 Tax=Corynebacterium occultum TaxID=2675219 RepID=UPI001E3A479B|nr:lysoplasmalogenase [Corynebacterium occultum]